jgi:flavin-dependent dehydrogenase
MSESAKYDVAIIGGGLAGLSLSIQLKASGYSVVLFEKEVYPFHKVCGEYISLESWYFLLSLGLPLATMNLPIIKKLLVSSPDGNLLQHTLPLGGFGISRYQLDNMLRKIATNKGVALYDGCKVEEVIFENESFKIKASSGEFISKICCGSFGKRSNIDINLKRDFTIRKSNKLNNYIGVKYHIKTDFPVDTIALHNFENGYCGISKIEDDKYCLCYLTTAANLKSNGNSITAMEQNLLYRNKYLQQIFENCEMLYKAPVTISQVSFSKKTQVDHHILMMGDAAGMITPLCGNGMSMALRGSKIVNGFIDAFLQEKISRQDMESGYSKKWQQTFSGRMTIGRLIQKTFGKEWVTNRFVGFMKLFPALTNSLIEQTHGKPF